MADDAGGENLGDGAGDPSHKHSRLHLSTDKFASLVHEQGVVEQSEESFARTRRGSFVASSPPNKDGLVTVDILNSQRTSDQR